jgi:hypothetical protein
MKRRFIMLAAIYMALPAILLAQPKEQPPLVGLWELKIRQNGVAAEVIAAKLEAALRPRRIYQDRVEQNNFGDSYQSVQPFIRKFKADAAAASLAHEN